jgi:hypothetical protein
MFAENELLTSAQLFDERHHFRANLRELRLKIQ